MNNRNAAQSICVALILSSVWFPAPAEEITNAIQAYLHERVEVEKKDAGIVVGLVDEQGNRIVGCGKLNNGRGVDGDTLFQLGSITKTFTALLLQEMIVRGEM